MAATDPRLRGQGRLDPDGARAIAERLHHGQREAGGMPLLDHVRRVVAAVPLDARVVAWLHEVFEYTSVPEETLLAEGLRTSELRALETAHPRQGFGERRQLSGACRDARPREGRRR